jgi:uncharacterized protein (TIGR02996 family)
MKNIEPFLRDIEANPADGAPYLALSGWLLAHGHPAGELIAVQCALEKAPDDARLKARETQLLKTHRAKLIGPILTKWAKRVELSWRRGFIRHARLAVGTGMAKTGVRPAQMVHALFQQPWCRALHRLDFDKMMVKRRNDYRGAIEAVLQTGRHPTIRTFAIGHMPPIVHCSSRSTTKVGSLKGLSACLPNLTTLYVRGGGLDFGEMGTFEHLDKLVIDTDHVTQKHLEDLSGALLIGLNELYIHSGTICQIPVDDLLHFFDQSHLRQLRRVRFSGGFSTDRVMDALTRSSIIGGLESLDLHNGLVGDKGAVALKAAAGQMARLQKLDLTNNSVSSQVKRDLKKALAPDIRMNMSVPSVNTEETS